MTTFQPTLIEPQETFIILKETFLSFFNQGEMGDHDADMMLEQIRDQRKREIRAQNILKDA